MGLTPVEWDRQFTRQAAWTRATRNHLYRRANLLRAERVLDVGSGSGVVTEELASRTGGEVVGIDLNPEMVDLARSRQGRARYEQGDAHDLPFPNDWFDVTVCHFVLMWCRCASEAAREMVRVTRPDGSVLVCAEPDYGGRIDHPSLPLGRWQVEALRREGADACMGRKLRELFTQPRVGRVEVGLIPGLWDRNTFREEFAAEWASWEPSFAPFVPSGEICGAKEAELAAIESGSRLAFLPVFYAYVRV